MDRTIESLLAITKYEFNTIDKSIEEKDKLVKKGILRLNRKVRIKFRNIYYKDLLEKIQNMKGIEGKVDIIYLTMHGTISFFNNNREHKVRLDRLGYRLDDGVYVPKD